MSEKVKELSGQRKVLIVDDDASLVKMLNIRLWAEGYDTELAVSGSTAIALAREQHPDIIVLDIAMPGVTGVDVIEQLEDADEGIEIPVIIMTAYPHMVEMVENHPAVKECLIKPFDLRKLVAKIKDILTEETAPT
jgi:DNA-binding response OmpR family regulator